MLHELFIALAGYPSPLFDGGKDDEYAQFVSPSERSLLTSLARLGSLQAGIRASCKNTSSNHGSLICRSVSSYIVSESLARYQEKVVQVEAAVLSQSPEYVGAYDIVPLSSIVQAFDGWTRRLEWLYRIASVIEGGPETRSASLPLTGAALINLLRREIHTGYPELESTALELLQVGEAAWLRQVSSWVLNGENLSYGRGDFFIQSHQTESSPKDREPRVQKELLPEFVDDDTANSLLFIGRTLGYIRRGAGTMAASITGELEKARSVLLAEHTALLRILEHPIQSFNLRNTVARMRLSLSRNALQKLLPLQEILKMLDVLREFMLLQRGEFAVALINSADECLSGRHTKVGSSRDSHRLGGMMIKEGEIASVLARTWSSLVALQDVNEDNEDETLELSRRIVTIGISKAIHTSADAPSEAVGTHSMGRNLFYDVLFGTPVSLSMLVIPPQDLFLSSTDIDTYSRISSYLLSIRRAGIHLSQLWQLDVLRKSPSPWYVLESGVQAQRAKANERNQVMRRMWTIISRVHFFFNQLGNYFQGEVVPGCTNVLHEWLRHVPSSRPAQGHQHGRPLSDNRAHSKTASVTLQEFRSRAQSELLPQLSSLSLSNPPVKEKNESDMDGPEHYDLDPESATLAHRTYLRHLTYLLLLDDVRFTTGLRNLITRADHMIALTKRLAVVTVSLQSEDDGPHSTRERSHLGREESDLFKSMDSVRKSLQSGIEDLTARLNDIDEERRTGKASFEDDLTFFGGSSSRKEGLQGSQGSILIGLGGGREFRPWREANLARLLMRLEPSEEK